MSAAEVGTRDQQVQAVEVKNGTNFLNLKGFLMEDLWQQNDSLT